MFKTRHLTELEIVYAAQSIAATGTMPTIASVRAYLGGRGSESTLHKYLQKWKSGLLSQTTINSKRDANQALANRIKELEEINQQLSYERNLALKIIKELRLDDTLIEERAKNLSMRKKIQQIKLELENLKALL